MRCDDWDVILFPKDSKIPIQEFKTACYHACDANTESHKAPTLTCYISSLPPATTFRISIHSWTNSAKPSAVIEAQRKPSQKIVYMVQVVIDGVRVYHNLFDVASRWPQEIMHERRTLTDSELPTSERKPHLEFPAFSQRILMQPAWQPRDSSSRINVLLSEQLVNKHSSLEELDLGMTNDIVCFSFQPAPRDILEQAGISWPIRNPLYLSDAPDGCFAMQTATQPSFTSTKVQNSPLSEQTHSPLSRAPGPVPRRPQSHDTLQRPRSHPPPLAHLFKPPRGDKSRDRSDIWEDSFGSFRDDHDNISLGSWPTQPSGSHMAGDIFTSGCNASMGALRAPPSWLNRPTDAQRRRKPSYDGQQRQDKQIVVTLRDDQLGQIIHAISPPKTLRNLPHDGGAQNGYSGRPSSTQLFNPFTGFVPHPGRSSKAALAGKSSYLDLAAAERSMSRKSLLDEQDMTEVHNSNAISMSHPSATSNKENLPPSQSRLPTPFPYASRVPTPMSFAPILSQWNSGMLATNESSKVTEHPLNLSRASVPSETHNNHGPAHVPSNYTSIKGRKEGLASDSRILSERRTRRDPALLPPTNSKVATPRDYRSTPTNTPNMLPKLFPAAVEIIDVDAIDPDLDDDAKTPFLDATKLSTNVPHHKQGVSSVNSLGSVERKVITYVGAEVSRDKAMASGDALTGVEYKNEQDLDADADTIVVALGGRAYETAAKRKRSTVDGEGVRKREKGELDDGEVEVAKVDLQEVMDE